MSKTFNYQETLDAVENFMIETGIRKFCAEICKGQCCLPHCHNTDNSCTNNEGRRLTCSAYVCHIPGTPTGILVRDGGDAIKKVVLNIYRKNKYFDTTVIWLNSVVKSIYFERPHPALFTDFEIAQEIIKCSFVRPMKKVRDNLTKVLEHCRTNGLANNNKLRLSGFYVVGNNVTSY